MLLCSGPFIVSDQREREKEREREREGGGGEYTVWTLELLYTCICSKRLDHMCASKRPQFGYLYSVFTIQIWKPFCYTMIMHVLVT